MERKRLSKTEREAVYQKCNGHCAYCGSEITFKELVADHVDCLARGGADATDNMLPSCRSCNRYKSTYTVEEFREQLGLLHRRMMRDSSNYALMYRFGIIKVDESTIEFYFEKIGVKP